MEIRRLIDDLGGAAEVSSRLSLSRTTPYRWINNGMISSKVLDLIVAEWAVDLMDYFDEGDVVNGKKKRRRKQRVKR